MKVKELLKAIDKKIIETDKEATRTDDSYRATFLEGKSAGLKAAYTIIKIKFDLP